MTEHGCKHSFTWTTNTTSPFSPPNGYLAWCGSCGTWGRWENAGWVAQTESPGSMAMAQAERFGDALTRILAIIGPASCGCEGCAVEIDDAIDVIREVHGV